jgi:hypothetical protein
MTETTDAAAAAGEMIRRLWAAASAAITSEKLTRQDRFGYEADMRLLPLHRNLVGLGWIVETSTRGSVYYSKGGERLRLSNHEVPQTAERDHAAENGRWSWHRCGYQIITERQTVDQCLGEIDEIEAELSDN